MLTLMLRFEQMGSGGGATLNSGLGSQLFGGGGFGEPVSWDSPPPAAVTEPTVEKVAQPDLEDDDEFASGGSEDDYSYSEDEDAAKAADVDPPKSTDTSDPAVDALSSTLSHTDLTSNELPSKAQWTDLPSYIPMYLNTNFEYITPQPKATVPKAAVSDPKDAKDAMWAMEGYERSRDVDEVFERFMKRVAEEGEQCIRCDHPRP